MGVCVHAHARVCFSEKSRQMTFYVETYVVTQDEECLNSSQLLIPHHFSYTILLCNLMQNIYHDTPNVQDRESFTVTVVRVVIPHIL